MNVIQQIHFRTRPLRPGSGEGDDGTVASAMSARLLPVVLAFLLLSESFTVQQWIGAGLFLVSVLLIRRDTGLQIADEDTWWLSLFPEPTVEDRAKQGNSSTGTR